MYPNAPGTYHWDKVDDPTGSPDDGSTYVDAGNTGSQAKDSYNLTDTAVNAVINSVTVYFRIGAVAGTNTVKGQPFLRLGGVETTGTEVTFTCSLSVYWGTYSETLARPGGGTWSVSDINSLQVCIGLRKGTSATNRCTQEYISVNYNPIVAPTVTISAASSVTDIAARLNGNITNTGYENPTVKVFWGDNDGGTTPGNWDNNPGTSPDSPGQPQGVAAFYLDISGLSPNVTYYFSARAVNSGGTSWPAASLNFTTTFTLSITNVKTFDLLPDGVGDYTNIEEQFPNSTAHWDKVDDAVASPDDDSTYLRTTSTSQQKDAFSLQDAADTGGTITSVTVYFRFRSGTASQPGYAQPFLRLSSTETTGTEILHATTAYTNYYETLARPGGGSWSWADLNSLQVCIGLKSYAIVASNPRCTQVYVHVVASNDWDFGSLAASGPTNTANTGLACFTLTNDGNVVENVSIHGHDATGAGVTWTLSDTGAGGDAIYGLDAGLSGGSYNIVVRKNTVYNELKHGLAVSGTQQWGLEIYAPTNNATIGSSAMTGTITLTASLHV
jgi:hypothetical protein